MIFRSYNTCNPFQCQHQSKRKRKGSLNITLPETNIAPENGWLEYYRFLLGRPIFRCENVSFREGTNLNNAPIF